MSYQFSIHKFEYAPGNIYMTDKKIFWQKKSICFVLKRIKIIKLSIIIILFKFR